MLRSMTGFGRCLVEDTLFAQQWEIKSVNSRHLDLKWRLPLAVRCLEPRLEKIVRKFAQRGRMDVSLSLQYAAGVAPAPAFDAVQAGAMLDALEKLALERGDEFTPHYHDLLSISSLWGDNSEEMDDTVIGRLEEGLTLALQDWNESRTTEGRALATDMVSRILRMEEWTEIIQNRAPEIKEDRVATVRERITEALAQNGTELDEGRFLQEIVILADKLDVSEELTRLHTHLERLRQLIEAGKDAGRRLEFTLQECFREINTCGNKIPDVQLSRLVVDFKNELEKCREQVQNLE
ncbi:MAG: YicC/YloC family endoribonuclease [Desulfovibrionaceae bacterium]